MIPIDFVTYVGATETIRLSRPVFDQMLDAFGTRMLVEAVRGGRPEQKRNLMGICWQATFKPAHRKEKNAQPNGLFALDIDHIGHDAVTDLWQRTMPRTDELDIVCFHRSPSGDGARVVALCQPQFETIAENQYWLASALQTPYDAACHDLARLFFVSVREDFYFIDYETLFNQ